MRREKNLETIYNNDATCLSPNFNAQPTNQRGALISNLQEKTHFSFSLKINSLTISFFLSFEIKRSEIKKKLKTHSFQHTYLPHISIIKTQKPAK